MSAEIRVPRLAESISDAVLVEWLKPDGAIVRVDEPIATLETDKAAVEIAADSAGALRHASQVGDRVIVGQVIARIEASAGSSSGSGATSPPGKSAASAANAATQPAIGSAAAIAPAPAAPSPAASLPLRPSVRRLVEERGLDPSAIPATGPGGKILKEDVMRVIEDQARSTPEPATAKPAVPAAAPAANAADAAWDADDQRVVPMSRLRQRIAQRLVEAQNTAAILTTFNEIDMTAVLELRAKHKDAFEKKHGVKLGFMSLFGMASMQALAETPELNAEIRGTDIVYRRHVHLGVAVGTPRGLVVPIVRRADTLDLAGIEREIARLASHARDGSISLDEMVGGTFTISNGGVYGSLLSTPILNPPQSGILGMHKIEPRPVAIADQVVIRPMMYVALSYDHRIIDGEQAVTFLVHVKQRLEDPERMLLQV